MAANIEPFTAFCHDAKLDWKERFQRNWLNSLVDDQICNHAFIQAKEKTMVELLSWSQIRAPPELMLCYLCYFDFFHYK